jgi:hypothetical protein
MDDKIDPTQKLPADPLDDELRALWTPAPAASPVLREKLLAAVDAEAFDGESKNSTAPYDLAARRSGGASRRLAGPQRHGPLSGISRSVMAAMGAVVLLVGARIAMRQAHLGALQSRPGQVTSGQVDPNELTAEDEQFALGVADDDDADDPPSVLELAADDE